MLITFVGRKSGRTFTTPVRYSERDGRIRCFTATTNQWWRNLRGGAEVTLRVRGHERRYRAEAVADDPARVRIGLEQFLAQFPQDAAYYDLRLNAHGKAEAPDLDIASRRTVMVEAILL